MARIRSNNVFGTTTDDPLTDSATTMNSAGLANLAAVTGSDEAIITLDPNRVNGAPEIVRVTAHTGSATSATIDRAEFDTTAREHPAGTEWVHGATAATASDIDGDFFEPGAWQAWTPTLTNLTLGDGTVDAKFTRIGRTIHFRFHFIMGSTSAVGSNPRFSLPVAPHALAYGDLRTFVGQALLRDAGTATFHGVVRISNTFGAEITTGGDLTNGIAAVSATAPFTWSGANADGIFCSGVYEAAA